MPTSSRTGRSGYVTPVQALDQHVVTTYRSKIFTHLFMEEGDCRQYSMYAGFVLYLLGHPKPKKMLIFRFVGMFEDIILLMLILFLGMCQNS